MKIGIIDDEKSNRDILIYLINQIQPETIIAGEAENVKAGVELINRCKPDLIFLDIEMPDGTGFDLIQLLDEYKPEIIFCTAYNQFALKARLAGRRGHDRYGRAGERTGSSTPRAPLLDGALRAGRWPRR